MSASQEAKGVMNKIQTEAKKQETLKTPDAHRHPVPVFLMILHI